MSMADSRNAPRSNGRRRSILDLAPLERDCMLALWPLGEATVRQIREELADTRPRAYTTIMTIMDRLTKKGVVTRHKVGRGYVYRPNFSAEELRVHAVAQLVDHFFAGSNEALLAHLGGAARATIAAQPAAPRAPRAAPPASAFQPLPEEEPETSAVFPRLDESLL